MDARSLYRESAVRGAGPVRLVICLYEQAIEDLRRAVAAVEREDIEGRTRSLDHALQVIAQLQGSLNRDRGGAVAANLDKFYNTLRAGLIAAQAKQSRKLIEEQIALLSTVHGAWIEAERMLDSQTNALPGSAAQALGPPQPGSAQRGEISSSSTSLSDWSA